jgi:hypothetical protein
MEGTGPGGGAIKRLSLEIRVTVDQRLAPSGPLVSRPVLSCAEG